MLCKKLDMLRKIRQHMNCNVFFRCVIDTKNTKIHIAHHDKKICTHGVYRAEVAPIKPNMDRYTYYIQI